MLSRTIGELNRLAYPQSSHRGGVVAFWTIESHHSANIGCAIETKEGFDHVLVLRLEVPWLVLEQLRLVVLAQLLQLAEEFFLFAIELGRG